MSDRTYVRKVGARTTHAVDDFEAGLVTVLYRTLCRQLVAVPLGDHFDRVPANGHLCGNCSRIIAARTDIEPTPEQRADFKRAEYARIADLQERTMRRVEDVPEPVATEHDDFEGAVPV